MKSHKACWESCGALSHCLTWSHNELSIVILKTCPSILRATDVVFFGHVCFFSVIPRLAKLERENTTHTGLHFEDSKILRFSWKFHWAKMYVHRGTGWPEDGCAMMHHHAAADWQQVALAQKSVAPGNCHNSRWVWSIYSHQLPACHFKLPQKTCLAFLPSRDFRR